MENMIKKNSTGLQELLFGGFPRICNLHIADGST